MVTIPVGDWFKLPFMGKDIFVRLTREANLGYDSDKGFLITPATNLGLATSILRTAIGEDVDYTVKCFICGSTAPCNTCIYAEICDKRVVSSACVCDICEGKEEAYTLYSLKFAQQLEVK